MSNPSAASKKTKTSAASGTKKKAKPGFVAEHIEKERSPDLVFAVTGYLGAGMEMVAGDLAVLLKKPHSFEVSVVKVSRLLTDEAKRQRKDLTPTPPLGRTRALQVFGDELREEYGMAVVAGLVIREIDRLRKTPIDGKRAFVIDCCKHPEEVDALRLVYGRGFYLVSSICDLETRKSILRGKFSGESDTSIEELMEIDAAEDEDWGQQVRKTIPLADYFVNANPLKGAGPNREEQLRRLLDLVVGTEVCRPSKDERGMYAAWGAAMRSACLSRQVGSSILNVQGIVIATGTNDVPAPGGGLYSDDSEVDARCFLPIERDPGRSTAERQRKNIQLRVLGQEAETELTEIRPFCRNDFTKDVIWQKVSEKLNETIWPKVSDTLRESLRQLSNDPAVLDLVLEHAAKSPLFSQKTVKSILKTTPIKDLVEFSRALHAEADALLSLARSGGPSCQDASLYVNVFPCHVCTRQIIAAGIKEVIYIEPYPKSMALILHDDAIRDPEQKDGADRGTPTAKNKLVFRLFSGVAPRRYVDLFEKHPDLKREGELRKERKRPFDPLFRKSHVQFEDSIAKEVSSALEGQTSPPSAEDK
jgi:deoxycytidylate deaminase